MPAVQNSAIPACRSGGADKEEGGSRPPSRYASESVENRGYCFFAEPLVVPEADGAGAEEPDEVELAEPCLATILSWMSL
jgi:hypothetical protein